MRHIDRMRLCGAERRHRRKRDRYRVAKVITKKVIGPLQFAIGLAYGEPLRTAHLIAFPAIWIALALYASALLRAPRLPQPPE